MRQLVSSFVILLGLIIAGCSTPQSLTTRPFDEAVIKNGAANCIITSVADNSLREKLKPSLDKGAQVLLSVIKRVETYAPMYLDGKPTSQFTNRLLGVPIDVHFRVETLSGRRTIGRAYMGFD